MSIDRDQIEAEARRMQIEVWQNRDRLYQVAQPPLLQLLSPEKVARFHGLEYEEREHIAPARGGSNFRAAGMFDLGRGVISVSREFSFETRRFTGAHELGHFALHSNQLGYMQVLGTCQPVTP